MTYAAAPLLERCPMPVPEEAAYEPVLVISDPKDGRRRVVYEFQPPQIEAFNLTPLRAGRAGQRHIGYGGAAGGGKSYWGRALAVVVALAWPGSTGIIFRESYPELEKNHIRPFLAELAPWEGILWRYIKSERTVEWKNGPDPSNPWRGGSQTLFGYLEREDHLRRYQGNAYDFMCFEEATHYPELWVQWLVGNRLRSSVAGTIPFAVYPSNPGGVGHAWYKRIFVDRAYELRERPAEYGFVQALVEENEVLMQRDPEYVEKLDALPEPYRSWYLLGDFQAGLGLALPQLRRDLHLIDPFDVPASWPAFASLDWGWAHNCVFILWRVNEDGRLFVQESVWANHLQISELDERWRECLPLPVDRLAYVSGSRDLWNKRGRELGENLPSFAEQLIKLGYRMRKANQERIKGLNNIRQGLLVNERLGEPMLAVFDTPANRDGYRQLENLPADPKNAEDALKFDADEFGRGGDDWYESFRYGVNSRAWPAKGEFQAEPVAAWAPEVLAREAEEQRRGTLPARVKRRMHKGRPIHPEFGTQY